MQGRIRFDERFGLGTQFLTCGEEEVWLEDALRMGLNIHYYPEKIVETSTMLKKSLVYVDAGVQRSHGAIDYYKHGNRACGRASALRWIAPRRDIATFYP